MGSILGPSLFLIYVNDFYLASKFKNVMFADDKNLFLSDENISELFQQTNKELKSVSTWFKANKLSINIDKIKWTIFYPTSKKRFMPTKLPELFIDGIILKRETVITILGVIIDENATWKAHINTISTKISKSICILYKARLIIPRKQLNQLYFSFVRSYLNYANIAWGSTQKIKLSILYAQQKHASRFLSFKDQFRYSRPLFKEIGALNIYEINIFNILCLMFKCKNKAFPKAFENLFTLKPKNKYQLKRSCTFLDPFCKSKFSQLCINYCRQHLWNTIVLSQSTDLEHSIALKISKERLKAYIFTLDDVTFLFLFCVL